MKSTIRALRWVVRKLAIGEGNYQVIRKHKVRSLGMQPYRVAQIYILTISK
jgi:hypothetical protein